MIRRTVFGKKYAQTIYEGKNTTFAFQSGGGIFMTSDGLELYHMGSNSDWVRRMKLTTPFDASTITWNDNIRTGALNPNGDTSPGGVFFKPDMTQFFIGGVLSKKIYRYNRQYPWIISPTENTLVQSATQTNPIVLCSISSDGVYAYARADGTTLGAWQQYQMSTPWDPSTATLIYSQTDSTIPYHFWMKPDGTEIFVLSTYLSANSVVKYKLVTPFMLSTRVLVSSTNLSAMTFGSIAYGGIWLSPDGLKMVISSGATKFCSFRLTNAFNPGQLVIQ